MRGNRETILWIFLKKSAELTKKVRNIGDTLGTEEATKNALVMPFIAMR